MLQPYKQRYFSYMVTSRTVITVGERPCRPSLRFNSNIVYPLTSCVFDEWLHRTVIQRKHYFQVLKSLLQRSKVNGFWIEEVSDIAASYSYARKQIESHVVELRHTSILQLCWTKQYELFAILKYLRYIIVAAEDGRKPGIWGNQWTSWANGYVTLWPKIYVVLNGG